MNAFSPHAGQTVELLLELHALMSCGKEDSDEADAIRDRMDYPWYQLDERETRLARRLSADLYTIDPNEPSKHPPSGSGVSKKAQAAIVSCLDRKDWEGLLAVLREQAEEIPVDKAAYYRGRCWCELGFDNVAQEFLTLAREVQQ